MLMQYIPRLPTRLVEMRCKNRGLMYYFLGCFFFVEIIDVEG
jgi:hypothetical protein